MSLTITYMQQLNMHLFISLGNHFKNAMLIMLRILVLLFKKSLAKLQFTLLKFGAFEFYLLNFQIVNFTL